MCYRIVICMYDSSLDDIFSLLEKCGKYQIRRVAPSDQKHAAQICKERNADILLLGIDHTKEFCTEERMTIIDDVRENVPNCKIILYANTALSASESEVVKRLYAMRFVDDVILSSDVPESLLLKLDTVWSQRELAERHI